MARYLNLASKWDCVLLIDEADVFLASRDRGDLVRNALVAGKYFNFPSVVSNVENP